MHAGAPACSHRGQGDDTRVRQLSPVAGADTPAFEGDAMTETAPFRHPIAILSYNRPHYLREVLVSLAAQSLAFDPADVHLFQDGYRSRFGGPAVDETLKDECVAVFRTLFPEGVVHASDVNLGIALHFDKAERFFFEERGVDCAVFLEDDLILGPDYLAALDQLIDFALGEDLVAYVAAYGDHRASLETQCADPAAIIPMQHKWGFALTKRQWLRQREILEGYLAIVREREYAKRDVKRISAYFRTLGYDLPASSQDAAKDIASMVLGTAKVMTRACFGRYIGQEGVHFSKELFTELGFDKAVEFSGPLPTFRMPDRDTLARWADAMRRAGAIPPASAAANAAAVRAPGLGAAEIAALERWLGRSTAVLVYGVNGIAELAAATGVARLVGIDSDAAQIAAAEADPAVLAMVAAGRAVLRHVDIGPVREWGYPRDKAAAASWPAYSLAAFDGPDAIVPDLVVAKGRFRVGVVAQAILANPAGPVFVLPDFWSRRHYHPILEFVDEVERVNDMLIARPKADLDLRRLARVASTHLMDPR